MKIRLSILFMIFLLTSCGSKLDKYTNESIGESIVTLIETQKSDIQEKQFENSEPILKNKTNIMENFKLYIKNLLSAVNENNTDEIKKLLGNNNIAKLAKFMKKTEDEAVAMMSDNISMLNDGEITDYTNEDNIYTVHLDFGMKMHFEKVLENFQGYFPDIPSIEQIDFLNSLENRYILSGRLSGNINAKIILNGEELDTHKGHEVVNVMTQLMNIKDTNKLEIILSPDSENEEVEFSYIIKSVNKENPSEEPNEIENISNTEIITEEKKLIFEFDVK